ncbi:MAG: hypothetical protein AAGA80_12360 [Cyanobacteria bacterium P01_F01_bin.143]
MFFAINVEQRKSDRTTEMRSPEKARNLNVKAKLLYLCDSADLVTT